MNTQISPLPSNTWLEFDNATITVGSGLATNVFAATGKSNLYFTGVVSFIGTGGGTANVFLLSACSRVHFNWDASVVGLSQSPVKYLINAGQSGGTQSTQMKLEGRTLTDGSVVFIGKDVSLVESAACRVNEEGSLASMAMPLSGSRATTLRARCTASTFTTSTWILAVNWRPKPGSRWSQLRRPTRCST